MSVEPSVSPSAPAAASGSWIADAAGLAPGLVAAVVAGATAVAAGPVVAAGVACALALPLGAASLAAARGRGERETRELVIPGLGVAAGVVLAVFGAVLKANTHHRALAGVTFAIVALGVLGGAAVVGLRGRQLSGRSAAGWGVAALGALVTAWLVLRAGGRGLDVVLALGSVAASWWSGPRPSRALGVGALGAVAAATVGAIVLLRDPAVAEPVAQRSVLASGVVPLVASDGPASLAQPASDH